MGPEEFYYIDKINRINTFEMRIVSLQWMLDCYRRGTIRRATIIGLIPDIQLIEMLQWLEDEERYEDCVIVKNVLDEIYT
jgi:hypothetical protein